MVEVLVDLIIGIVGGLFRLLVFVLDLLFALVSLVRSCFEKSPGTQPRGFEVKQIPGREPGAEEKDIDHG